MNLLAKPFYLNQTQIDWVENTYREMSLDEKIGQLFVPIGFSKDREYLDNLLEYHIGGLFFRPGTFDEMKETLNYLQTKSKIPLFLPANLEMGPNGAITDAPGIASPMAVAATRNVDNAYRLGMLSASESQKVGINWGFSPVVDLDLEFHNPITNVRTFGDDVHRVIKYGKAFIEAFDENNMITSPKHFPGDGVDERDQHLLTSINTLSKEAWRASYGKIYQELIEFGVKSIMIGHIALPAFSGDEMPASLSEKLLQELLRKELGFNGLIITDATPMVGFLSAMPREKAVPLAIEYGNDMFLFFKAFEEDYAFMKGGYEKGLLSESRLEEAVKRILATKASIGLHERISTEGSSLSDSSEIAWQIAGEAITLVKNDEGLLPISSKEYKRVLLEILGDFPSNERVVSTFKTALESKGFEVTLYQNEQNFYELETLENFKSSYDLVIYAANIENSSNQTTARLKWHTLYGLGNNLPWFVKEVPTLFVSFGNPYHMFDVPMIDTFINAYSNYDHFIEQTVNKIVGESNFVGKSPVDPSCKNIKLKGIERIENY